MTNQAKRRWVWGTLLVLAAAALLLWPSERPDAAAATASPGASVAKKAAAEPRRRPPVSRGVREPTTRPPVDNIVIEKVEVDKQELCRGEDATVTIVARSVDEEDEYLAYGSLGHPELVGPRFTFKPEESVGVDWMKIFVRGKFGTSVIASVPPILVKDCQAPLSVVIDYRRLADAQDRALLAARISIPGDGAGTFEPVAYEWDFGDGVRETTATAEVSHSYENRRQTQAYSYFFVTLKARDGAGRVAQGSRSLRFVNLGFRPMLNEDRVVVFASIDQEGETERVSLYHGAPYPVRLERVTVKDVSTDESGAEQVIASRDYDAASLLGFSELPAGKSMATRDLGELRPTTADALRIIEVAGRGPGAKRASGSFTLLAPAKELAQHDSVGSKGTEIEE